MSEGQLDYSSTPQSTGSSILSYPTMSDENQQTMNNQEQGSKDNAQENQQFAEAGEFDQLLGSVNNNLTELGMQEDSVGIISALTEIANAGNPEHRVWACKMLNWHNEMQKFMKGNEK